MFWKTKNDGKILFQQRAWQSYYGMKIALKWAFYYLYTDDLSGIVFLSSIARCPYILFSVSPTHASPAWFSLYPVVHSHRDPPIVLVQMPFSQNPGTSVHSLISGEKLIERWWENSGKVNYSKSKSMSRSNLSPYLCLCLCVCFCAHLL